MWDVDLTVTPGSRTCLMGRNGMGKTTPQVHHGADSATNGGITFEGTDLMKQTAEERARLGIGYVPQGREIFAATVEEKSACRARHSEEWRTLDSGPDF